MSNIANTATIQNLIISIIGTDQSISLLPLFKLISDFDGNVINSKISQFGSHFAGMLVIDGRWDAITRIEQALSPLESKLQLKIQSQRSCPEITYLSNANHLLLNQAQDQDQNIGSSTDNNTEEEQTYLPYKISINNLDEPGLLQKITEFFALQELTIQDLNATTYIAEFGAELAQIDIKIKIPSDIHIPSLREQFDVLCYNENLDASLTPHKAL
jgi:glycine cleavage system transcriptional repressor